MEEKFLQESKIVEKTEEEKDLELMREVIKTKIDLNLANKNFEYAEGDLIDYYSYQIKAGQAKLDYLLKKIKNKALALDMVNELKLRIYNNKAI